MESSEILNDDQSSKLEWLLAETFEKIKLRLEESALSVASNKGNGDITTLFNEEAGFVIEVAGDDSVSIVNTYTAVGVPCVEIGTSSSLSDSVKISVGGASPCINEKVSVLRDLWEATSFQLERRQRNPECVAQEESGLKNRKIPQWNLTYTPEATNKSILNDEIKYKVAIIRQEGSNGDREMISAFLSAGFEAWDVSVSDILSGNMSFSSFRGIVFVGGFSYADVLDSGKGWAGVIKFNEEVFQQFQTFRQRTDTFSLGVCNGCQLMALLGWVPSNEGLIEDKQPRLLHNQSDKFESRFSSVKITDSPAIMFKVRFILYIYFQPISDFQQMC